MPAEKNPGPIQSLTTDGIVYLGLELRRRTIAPIRHATFWAYLMLGVIGVGALGVWLEIVRYRYGTNDATSESILTAVVTFFPALIGSSSLQVIFQDTLKPMRAVAMIGLIISIILASWLILDHAIPKATAFSVALVICLVSVWIWWVANADDPTFKDLLDVAAPVGGPPDQPLSGDLTGFTH